VGATAPRGKREGRRRRRRVQARRSGSERDNDLATVVVLKAKYRRQVPATKDLANRRCTQNGGAPCGDRVIEVPSIYLTLEG
jgi:hypothetical protein